MKKITLLFIVLTLISLTVQAQEVTPDGNILFSGDSVNLVSVDPNVITKNKGDKIKWEIKNKKDEYKVQICIKRRYIWPFTESSENNHGLKCLAPVTSNKITATLLDDLGVDIPIGGYVGIKYAIFSEGNPGNNHIDPVIKIY